MSEEQLFPGFSGVAGFLDQSIQPSGGIMVGRRSENPEKFVVPS